MAKLEIYGTFMAEVLVCRFGVELKVYLTNPSFELLNMIKIKKENSKTR